jgi:hypothetical protein
MENKINNINHVQKSMSNLDFWKESMFQDFYIDYYQNLSSNELDREFNQNLQTLTRTLSKLSDSDRKAFIGLYSRFIEFYLENKIEKEINNAFNKILNF